MHDYVFGPGQVTAGDKSIHTGMSQAGLNEEVICRLRHNSFDDSRAVYIVSRKAGRIGSSLGLYIFQNKASSHGLSAFTRSEFTLPQLFKNYTLSCRSKTLT